MTFKRNFPVFFLLITFIAGIGQLEAQIDTLTINFAGTGSGQVKLVPPDSVITDDGSLVYNLNDVVTVIALPDTGSKFVAWSGDVESTDDTIQVEFQQLAFLTTNVLGTGNIIIDLMPSFPGGYYDVGEVVSLTASPGVGEDFLGWMGSLTTSNVTEMMTLEGTDYYVTAQFAPTGAEIVTVEGVFGSNMDYSFIGMELIPASGQIVRHEETQVGILDDGMSDTLTVSSAPLQLVDGNLYLATISSKGHSRSGVAGGALARTVTDTIWGLGLTWTHVAKVRAMRNASGLDMYMAQGTPSGQDSVTAIVHDFNAGFNVVISVSRYSGVDLASPVKNVVPVNAGGFTIPGSEMTGRRVDSGVWYKPNYSIKVPVTDGGGVLAAVAHRNQTHIPSGNYTLREDAMNNCLSSGERNSVATMDNVDPYFKLAVNVEGNGTVTLSPAAGGETITSDTVRYNPVIEVSAQAVPNPEWIFGGWSGDLTGTTNPDTLLMDADKSITASFFQGEIVLLEGAFSSGTAPANVDFILMAAELQPLNGEEVKWGESQSGIIEGAVEDTVTVTTDAPLTAVEGDMYLTVISTKKRSNPLSVSGLGLDWTFLKDQAGARDQTYLSLWAAQGTPTAAEVVTARVTSVQIGKDVALTVSRYSGVDTLGNVLSANSNGIDGAETGGTDASQYSIPFNRKLLDGLIFTAVAHRNRDFTPAPGNRVRHYVSAALSGNMVSITTADYLYHPINVSAGTGVLSAAIAEAPEGGFIVLPEAGPYFEADSITINKLLYLVAGKDVTPVIRTQAKSTIDLRSSLFLKGIQFRGSASIESAIINRADNLNDLTIENCEFTLFNGAAITNDDNYLKPMNHLIVKNSLFHDGDAGIVMNGDHPGAGQHPENIPGAYYLWIKNSSFYNLNNEGIKVEAYVPTGSDTAFATISHVTVNNCGGEAIYLKEVSATSIIENSIVTNSDVGIAIKYYPVNLPVTYSDVWNNQTNYSASSGGSASAGEGSISLDPQFVDPAAGNLNIYSSSPCVGKASDGSNMGDIVHWSIITSIEDENIAIPLRFALEQNYPNPFNPTTTIQIAIPIQAEVSVTIFNSLGQKVKTFSMDRLAPGTYQVEWMGDNDLGKKVGSGLYFYRMEAKSFTTKKVEFTKVLKMLLLK